MQKNNHLNIIFNRLIIILSFLFISETLISQISYETSKAALIFQFAKNIGHKNEKELKKYKICFLGNDINKIKGKTVELLLINNLNKLPAIQLLYIDKNWAEKISEVWYKIEKKNILLISEHSLDTKYIMLNILYNSKKKKISFEINKANIIIENLTFNAELLLLGGKEIDIRELYRNTKQLLDNKKHEVSQYKQVIEEQTQELQTLHKQADSLNINVTMLLNKISNSENKLDYLVDSIKLQQKRLALKLDRIKKQEIKLKNQQQKIKDKEKQIKKVTVELNNIIAEKVKNQKLIFAQKTSLVSKDATINKQNKQLTLIIAFVLLLIVLILAIFYAFRIRKKANKKQLFINKELESKKEVLEKTLQKLTETQSQLIHSEKMASLGVLTAGVAHEINNPVNYINSGVEGLKSVTSQITKLVSEYTNKNADEKTKKELDFLTNGIKTLTTNIQTGVKRTTEIIKSLNTFSHIDNDELSLADIHENIDSTTTLLYNQYKNRIKVIKNYNNIPKIYCYPSKLNQVFMNLISNAIQSIKNEGTITITTSFDDRNLKNNKYIKISIKDTGVGISEDLHSKIFEPFFTTKQVGSGTGLGLSITHGIIKQHNGKIDFTSSIEKGTEFKLYLPIISKKNNK